MRPINLSTTGAGASLPAPLDLYLTPFNVTLKAVITGTVDYDVQYTEDDVFAAGYNPAAGNWTPLVGMDGAVASAEATIISPVTAVRLVQNSGSGSISLRVLQAGIR